jgi:hypothetical protein
VGGEHLEKDSRSGPLTFVTVRTEIEQGGDLAIVDEQDIVYREPGTSTAPGRPADQGDEAAGPGVLEFDVDPVVLFRFSALTYNAHRIHYDRDHAVAEGHPDLVVHGPLQALPMGELLRRSGELTPGGVFSYQAGRTGVRGPAADRVTRRRGPRFGPRTGLRRPYDRDLRRWPLVREANGGRGQPCCTVRA